MGEDAYAILAKHCAKRAAAGLVSVHPASERWV